ncbi:MAG: ATP-binding protein [Candidatus Melainabacteria bacterium]|nr:ATP-binding protein [Candidatus Melainabacteria bacterium]
MNSQPAKSKTDSGKEFLDSFLNSPDRLQILEQAVASARTGIVITDPLLPDNPIVYANQAFIDLSGYPMEEILGKNCRFLQGADRDQPELKVLRSALNEGAPFVATLRNYKKNGALFWNELSISPVRDARGKVINYIGVQNDVTSRLEAERRVSEFYSMVSHELRTPMSSIRASLGLIDDGSAGELPPPAMRLIRIGLQNAERLLKLVDDILDMKKIESGKLRLNTTLVDPKQLITDAINSLSTQAASAHVQLETNADGQKQFLADPHRISQVLVNLVSNAIKFSPADTTISVKVKQEDSMMRFSVTDQGPGIDAGDFEKVFVKFQQLDSSDTRSQTGSGLGLAISKTIVELHGGNIGVESKKGSGSTFWFMLPMVPNE